MTIQFPKILCEFYIRFNDSYHPPIKPIERGFLATQELKKNIDINPTIINKMFGFELTFDIFNIIKYYG